MLQRVFLILTEDYIKKIKDCGEYSFFEKEMLNHGTHVKLYGVNEPTGDGINDKNEKATGSQEDCLYLSDDTGTLLKLQEKKKYTVAVYHEGVSGLLLGTQFALEGIGDVEWEYLHKVYQRFVGEPWYIGETLRCRIREMGISDEEPLYELYENPNVTRYTERLFENREQGRKYIKDYTENIYKYYGFGKWLIHRKEDGRLIGHAGFDYRPGYEEAELGFVIKEAFWRQGYGFEICSYLMDLAEKEYGLKRVQALVKKENTASIQLLRKLGFAFEEEVVWEGEVYQRYLSKLALSR